MSTELSAIKLMAIGALEYVKERIIAGDCSDEDLTRNMQRINLDINSDYINKNDYINTDQAIKIIGKGCNRTKFFELTKKYGIKNHTLNNQHIGFLKKEIEELAWKLKNMQ